MNRDRGTRPLLHDLFGALLLLALCLHGGCVTGSPCASRAAPTAQDPVSEVSAVRGSRPTEMVGTYVMLTFGLRLTLVLHDHGEFWLEEMYGRITPYSFTMWDGTWTLIDGRLNLLFAAEFDLGEEPSPTERRVLVWEVLDSGVQVPPGGYGGLAKGGPFLLVREE